MPFPVTVSIPVQWGDMDAYGHVNNTVYFRWFESARMAYFARCGFVESHIEDRIGAILHSTSCRFRLPVEYPDTVLVGARVTGIGDDRFTMAYEVRSTRHDKVAAEGTGVIVSFDYRAMRKTALPGQVRQAIEQLENSP